VEISKINLFPFTDSLALFLSLSRIRQQSHRGSRFARRHEALGKAYPGREALHLARVGVLRRFGWDRLGKLGRPFHEGDPNPRGTFSSFALSLSPSHGNVCIHFYELVFSARLARREHHTHRNPLSSQARAFYGFQIAIENIHSGTFMRS